MANTLKHTPVADIPAIHDKLHTTFKSGVTRPLEWRKQQLRQLARMFYENKDAIVHTLHLDLRKPDQEAALMEVLGIIKGAKFALDHIDEWVKPTKPTVEQSRAGWNCTIHTVPKGVICLISPWNFPWVLTFKPLAGAIAAGCAVVLKPSEVTAHSAALMAELVPKYLDPSAFVVINGAVPETTAMLNLRWDHIFYTGGVAVGRIIAAAAAKFVTPLTLELGGKSPVIIDEGIDLDLAARRILNGRAVNAGQLCVSPDYSIVLRSVFPSFLEALTRANDVLFPDGPFHPDAKWAKIVNERHADRLFNLLKGTKGKVYFGGKHQKLEDGVQIEPTVVVDVGLDDPLMEEEIFGPILPVLVAENLDEAISIINSLPKPLVIYPFTDNPMTKERILSETNSGNISFNDVTSILGFDELPFGGQGDSGYGSWHGHYTYKIFSQERVSIDVPASEETALEIRYRPYTKEKYEALSGAVQHMYQSLQQ
ncbi:aldehyde dehydrogenase [Irpex rosettiformis]|uniref:Aldehyde dehydrogenase n=1 Tax=Irpex rosettiformis TaxID=378272 RepID=A0ACB8U6B3_9APHY|nr:aldehyde dehydrogenase [Irpex rosettiformis]